VFFIASKLFGFLTTPSNVIAVVCAIGVLLLATRWRSCGARLASFGVVLMLVCGFSPLGNIMLLPLTERFPAWHDTGRVPDGIVILGGSINPELTVARGAPEINASAERMTTAAVLARRYPNARIVLSGGNSNPLHPQSTEAEVGRQFLENLGVPPGQIVMEDRSRTTFENAKFTRDLVHPKPGEYWLVVTSAYHMPRSIGAFRAVGFDVDAYPVDWRTRGWRDAWIPFDTVADGLLRLDTAVHEWVGLISYRLAGRSSDFFPGPER
jgi:uncharacterized SAM-binding protein YcdF (DUF218 family)